MILLNRWVRKWKNILVDLVSFIGIFWLFVEIASYSTKGSVDTYLKSVSIFFLFFVLLLFLAILKNKPKTRFGYHLRGKIILLKLKLGMPFKIKALLLSQ